MTVVISFTCISPYKEDFSFVRCCHFLLEELVLHTVAIGGPRLFRQLPGVLFEVLVL